MTITFHIDAYGPSYTLGPTYTDIVIQDKKFTIVESEHKFQATGSALSTLSRIEEVVRDGLTYSDDATDAFSELTRKELWETLKQKAYWIQVDYMDKTKQISRFRRLFGRVSKKEKAVRDAYTRIENLPDVVIQGDRFFIAENERKFQTTESALRTLSCIEEVMHNEWKYSDDVADAFSGLTRHELWETLRQKANLIQESYMEKTKKISRFRRLFGGISKKEKAVRDAYTHIKNLAALSPVLEVGALAIEHIFSSLSTREIRMLAQFNRNGRAHAKQAEILRAQEYDYQGHDLAEAKTYLDNLFQTVFTLVEDDVIPEEYVVYRDQSPSSRHVDSEATLKKIRRLSPAETALLKGRLITNITYRKMVLLALLSNCA